ncbi:helix-turn-helix domain-containing protein [Streptomyces sp. NPDC001795]|uniref:helix-turn-helix transcriptional regulator n=1 Tax=unclassified Streptomyces TaxID=2593676 RepID=UPI003322D786
MRQLRLAKDAMDRDWADPELDLGVVAAHAGYSRYHFIRAFKAAYGETPGQYLTHRRIERAEDLLRTANLSVTEICHLVGFSSVGTFSARFKAWTGLTPSDYRTKHVGRGVALIPGCYAMLWAGGFRPGAEREPESNPQSDPESSPRSNPQSDPESSPRSNPQSNSGEAR